MCDYVTVWSNNGVELRLYNGYYSITVGGEEVARYIHRGYAERYYKRILRTYGVKGNTGDTTNG